MTAPVGTTTSVVDEEWGLVEAAQRGDRNAFGLLYERHVDVVFRVVLFRVRDRSLAEDITGETFLHALRGISSMSGEGHGIRAWLLTIARNLVMDHFRSRRHRDEVVVADIAWFLAGLPGSRCVAGGCDDVVVERARTAELIRALAVLGRAQKQCVVARFFEDLSVAETAAVMGRTENAVKALTHRAVRTLARVLPAGLMEEV